MLLPDITNISHENAPTTRIGWRLRGDRLFAQGEKILTGTGGSTAGSTDVARIAAVYFQAATAAWTRAGSAPS